VTQEEGDVDLVAGVPDASAAEAPRTCAWCGTPAAPAATSCSSCGAALAQRESIGDLAIPGLTSVDAALQDYDKRPLHLRGPSPSQGAAPALIVGAMAGGPIGLAAIGGVAAVAAAEYLGARHGGSGALDDLGKPSEVVRQALGRLEDAGLPAAGSAANGDADAAALEAGRDVWRDLPQAAAEFENHQASDEHEEGSADGH
jgi:hypothetical protein